MGRSVESALMGWYESKLGVRVMLWCGKDRKFGLRGADRVLGAIEDELKPPFGDKLSFKYAPFCEYSSKLLEISQIKGEILLVGSGMDIFT